MERPFYTVQDVAELLGVTASRVYQLIAVGEIPAARIAGRIRVPVTAWDSWIGQQAAAVMPPSRGGV